MWIFEYERYDQTYGMVFDSLVKLALFADEVIAYHRRVIFVRNDIDDENKRYQVIDITG